MREKLAEMHERRLLLPSIAFIFLLVLFTVMWVGGLLERNLPEFPPTDWPAMTANGGLYPDGIIRFLAVVFSYPTVYVPVIARILWSLRTVEPDEGEDSPMRRWRLVRVPDGFVLEEI
jgi:heme A synthase